MFYCYILYMSNEHNEVPSMDSCLSLCVIIDNLAPIKLYIFGYMWVMDVEYVN